MENVRIYSYPHENTEKNSDTEIIASVKEYIADAAANISVQRDQYGKPHVIGVDGVYVSVAHDKDICLVAVAQKNIGIDIERADRIVKNPLALAKRYFCDDEIAFLKEYPTSASFTDMWVKKEALSKLIGRGIPSMDEKSIFSEDIKFEKIAICDKYIAYYTYYKD